jgi:hypothetical protein
VQRNRPSVARTKPRAARHASQFAIDSLLARGIARDVQAAADDIGHKEWIADKPRPNSPPPVTDADVLAAIAKIAGNVASKAGEARA